MEIRQFPVTSFRTVSLKLSSIPLGRAYLPDLIVVGTSDSAGTSSAVWEGEGVGGSVFGVRPDSLPHDTRANIIAKAKKKDTKFFMV